MIRLLDKNVSDKIAAGEVIERPVSVVKELVENALDAGAGSITCEIKNGGKSFIRVTDDGSGIPSDEAGLAFVRHATSKIETAEDLNGIKTLGFRGEALPSIASVTRTSMVTKTREERTGTRIVIHGGEIIEESRVGCPDGTTVIVSDLFYNTVPRRKFLKSDSAEAGRIIELVSELAAAASTVRFRMISSGKTVFSTRGSGDIKETLISVYHKQEYKDLLLLEGETPLYRVEGCISRPSLARSTRREQFFFVNGRVVDSTLLSDAVSAGYRKRLAAGRHPVIFLLLTCKPDMLDVNIHPGKREVRFHDEIAVRTFVTEMIQNRLAGPDAVIRAQDYYRNEEKKRGEEKIPVGEQIDIKQILETRRTEREVQNGHAGNGDLTGDEEAKEIKKCAENDASEYLKKYGAVREGAFSGASCVNDGELRKSESAAYAEDLHGFDISTDGIAPFDIKDLTVTGSIFDTYITCTDRDSFYLIDQHAAHERILYERLVSAYISDDKHSQGIFVPILIDVLPQTAETAEEWIPHLRRLGYELDLFGPDTLRITSVPAFMGLGEAESFVRDFLDQAENETETENRVIIDRLITNSCKSAVKAHDHLTYDEAKALMSELSVCLNPFSCPHGRPTFIRFTRHDIERFFKRV